MIPDKKLIEQRFAKAANTYEKQASIQRSVADQLLLMLDEEIASPPGSILEVGCCTGLLTAKLVKRFPNVASFTATDLVPSFKPYIKEKILPIRDRARFIAGDIETLEIQSSYDLIISSSTFHWIHDLPGLFRKFHDHLNPGGIFAFSLYGNENLSEIRQITGIGLPYRTLDEITACTSNLFEIVAEKEKKETIWFSTPLAVLQHLRQTGVNAVGSKAWTRSKLNMFIAEYEELFSGNLGVGLTYHPMFILARHKS